MKRPVRGVISTGIYTYHSPAFIIALCLIISTMLPLLRREARLLTNIRAFIPRSFGPIAGPLEACRHSRLLSTFDMGFVAHSTPQNELTSVRGGADAVASTDTETWGSLRGWRAQPRECSVRMMAQNTLAGRLSQT